jgi:hypothetical protein
MNTRVLIQAYSINVFLNITYLLTYSMEQTLS